MEEALGCHGGKEPPLGTDCARFNNLLGHCVRMRSQLIMACSVCAAHSGEARSSDDDSEEEETAGPSCEGQPLEQFWDGTLYSTFDQMKKTDGHMMCPDTTLTYLYFVLISNGQYQFGIIIINNKLYL